jgi:hypothetical protein
MIPSTHLLIRRIADLAFRLPEFSATLFPVPVPVMMEITQWDHPALRRAGSGRRRHAFPR